MDVAPYRDWLVSTRRDLHRHPEPGWREFYTTARLVAELEDLDVDEVLVGSETLDTEARASVPDESELRHWLERGRETADRVGLETDCFEQCAGGTTGAIATVHGGDGPTIALRVDIDGLPQRESAADDHIPAADGFRSANEGHMHACGHDAHMTIGLGVLRAVSERDFGGTLKVLFQPAEELIGGGKPMATSGHLDDVDALLAVHVGLDHPTGEVVAGIDDFLAVSNFDATFEGDPAHAGGNPNRGRNAVQAMATAVQNLYAIPRHEDGATRINAGKVGGGTASNIIPEEAFIHGEVRGETTALMEYTRDHATQVIESAAAVHDCRATVDYGAEAPSAESDQTLVEHVSAIASADPLVDVVQDRDSLGGSEDATYLMQRVQDTGGLATYVCIGTDHPGGHHTSTFDVDEASLSIGVSVLSDAILELAGPESPLAA